MNRPSHWCSRREIPSVRKEGDSNPRYGNPYGSLANCWFQPLTSFQKDYGVRNRGVISLIAGAKVQLFFEPTKYFPNFFKKKAKIARKHIENGDFRPHSPYLNACFVLI